MGKDIKAEKIKQKKCRYCKELYTPWSSTQQACSGKCAIELVKAKNEKAFKARNRKQKQEFNSWDKRYQTQLAVTWFNRYIRLRDADEPCISCGNYSNKYDAGHYKSAGAHPELRFEPLNCHKQCAWNCNKSLSGNIIEYRKRLIVKIGVEKVEWLEGPHDRKKYTLEDLKAIQAEFKSLCKELEQK